MHVTAVLLTCVGVWAAHAAQTNSRPAAQRWQAVTGTVQSDPSGRRFVILSQRDGRFMVDATGARIRDLGRNAAFSQVKAGRVVTAFGTRSGNTIRAEEVCICPTTPKPGRVAGYRSTNLGVTGMVTGVSGRTITVLSRRDGQFTVDAAGAQVRRYGDPASMDAVQRGLVIRAWGTSTGTRRIRANEICICPGSPGSGATASSMMPAGK